MNDKSKQLEAPQTTPSTAGDEQRAKEQAVNDQKIINGCAFAGAAAFFVLNLATGVVPGGFIGGAIGGGLGAVVGTLITSMRK